MTGRPAARGSQARQHRQMISRSGEEDRAVRRDDDSLVLAKVSAAQFSADADWVSRDLQSFKALLEA